MRLLICSDRNWTSKTAIKKTVENLLKDHNISLIIVRVDGDVDRLGRLVKEVARELDIPLLTFTGNWTNQQILDEGKPDYVCAFSDSPRFNNTEDALPKM